MTASLAEHVDGKRKLARACGSDQLILSGAAGSFRHVPVRSSSLPAVSFSSLDGVKSDDLVGRVGPPPQAG
jgi:hypothetical protein